MKKQSFETKIKEKKLKKIKKDGTLKGKTFQMIDTDGGFTPRCDPTFPVGESQLFAPEDVTDG